MTRNDDSTSTRLFFFFLPETDYENGELDIKLKTQNTVFPFTSFSRSTFTSSPFGQHATVKVSRKKYVTQPKPYPLVVTTLS